MIYPLVAEEDWLRMLNHCPEWECPLAPVLLLAPHPDDETLATGGLIHTLRSAGQKIAVVAVTDGENAYGDSPPIGELRAAEQREALAVLGVSANQTIRLQLPDRNVVAHVQSLVDSVLSRAPSFRLILAPWVGDFHPDHEACGRAAQSIACHTGAKLTFYFFWTWHRGTLALIQGKKLRKFPLSHAAMDAKAEALACHASQLRHCSGEPILPERLLAPARRSFEVYLDA